MKRYRLMEDCAEATADAIAFAKEVLRNPKAPIVLRFMAFDRLMNRAYGLPFRAADISQVIQETSVQKIIHEVRWLPSNAGAPVDQLSANPNGPRGRQDSHADIAIDPCAVGQLKRGTSRSRPDLVAAHNDPFASGRTHELSN
jgi:hypothetical protein